FNTRNKKMFQKVFQTILIFLFVALINGLPPGLKAHLDHKTNNDGSLIQPEVITIERLEALLRRASEIFKPSNLQRSDTAIVDVPQ
ncbi:hypothetical protein DOY81_009758, partial [Sarcophaga bullata]